MLRPMKSTLESRSWTRHRRGHQRTGGAALAQGASRSMPVFQVDPSWPKLPNSWVVGTVSSVTVDRRDHIWILHRPGTVQQGQQGQAAPPVIEFDANGAFVNAWGGAGQGYDWPVTEHGITVDYKDVVGSAEAASPMTCC